MIVHLLVPNEESAYINSLHEQEGIIEIYEYASRTATRQMLFSIECNEEVFLFLKLKYGDKIWVR